MNNNELDPIYSFDRIECRLPSFFLQNKISHLRDINTKNFIVATISSCNVNQNAKLLIRYTIRNILIQNMNNKIKETMLMTIGPSLWQEYNDPSLEYFSKELSTIKILKKIPPMGTNKSGHILLGFLE